MSKATDDEMNASWEATGIRFEKSLTRRPMPGDEQGSLFDGRGTKKGAGKKRTPKVSAHQMWVKKGY